ncbi:MAG: alpha/beta fold hydrolase [Bacteroidota bacterium]
MKRILFIVLLFASSPQLLAQNITGDWHGLLKQIKLRVVFHISETNNGFSSTLDSPDQGATGIPVTSTFFENDSLKITVANLGVTYKAKLVDNSFEGTFLQAGLQLPLKLTRQAIEKPKQNRPQEPEMPYPYYTEEVSFNNENANITLAGTLTLPEQVGKYPAVVLITGSGPQDRNEELAGHKPFLVIADHLTKNGIAVLRYDDRGFGQSTGDFSTATSTDFATDVQSAISYLKTRKEIDQNKIGLVGHSEGGIIAPMVASKSEDINFIVLLAGTGIRGDSLLSMQGRLVEAAMGQSKENMEKSAEIRKEIIDMVMKSEDIPNLRNDLTAYLKTETVVEKIKVLLPPGMGMDQFITTQLNFMATPWMVYFLRHDPGKILETVDCAVLALNGEKDVQVPPKENLSAIKTALEKAGNNKFRVEELPGLNHLFQECKTGAPTEYGTIEQTFSPIALSKISDWILDQVR